MKEENKTVQLGKVTPSFNKKIKDYAELIGKDKIEFIEEVLTKELEGKLLTNDFITLEKPFYFEVGYFDFNDPYNKIKTSSESLIGTYKEEYSSEIEIVPEDVYIIKKVPNNLDTFNKTYGKYCFENNPNRHKGLYIYHNFKDLSDFSRSTTDNIILLFDYNEETEELFLQVQELDKIKFKINLATHKEVYENIITEDKTFNFEYYEISEEEFIEAIFSSMDIIENYVHNSDIRNYLISKGFYSIENEVEDLRSYISDNNLNALDVLKEVFNYE